MKLSMLTGLVVPLGIASVWCGTGWTAGADYSSTVLGLKPIVYYHLNETGPQVPADMVTNIGTLGSAGNGFYLNDKGTPDSDYTHPTSPGALVASSDTCVSFTGAGNGRGGISIP